MTCGDGWSDPWVLSPTALRATLVELGQGADTVSLDTVGMLDGRIAYRMSMSLRGWVTETDQLR